MVYIIEKIVWIYKIHLNTHYKKYIYYIILVYLLFFLLLKKFLPYLNFCDFFNSYHLIFKKIQDLFYLVNHLNHIISTIIIRHQERQKERKSYYSFISEDYELKKKINI